MTYLIEATIKKDGGDPVYWKYYSDRELSKKDCLEMLSKQSKIKMKFMGIDYYWVISSGKDNRPSKLKLEKFSCKEVKNGLD